MSLILLLSVAVLVKTRKRMGCVFKSSDLHNTFDLLCKQECMSFEKFQYILENARKQRGKEWKKTLIAKKKKAKWFSTKKSKKAHKDMIAKNIEELRKIWEDAEKA